MISKIVPRRPGARAAADTPFRRAATLTRAWSLLQAFRFERTEPARFYRPLAEDTVDMVSAFLAGAIDGGGLGGPGLDNSGLDGPGLDGPVVLDVGGGPGYFADAFRARGAHYISVEPDPAEMHAGGIHHRGTVRGSGQHLPFADGSVDVCLSSNVVEHTPQPWEMADEMLRVTRPGGIAIVSYTLWWGPFGGHEMGLTHYLGGQRAARRYTRRHGHPPKNLYGTSLFAVTASDGLRWAATTSVPSTLIAAFPRYLPGWTWWVMRVPILREVVGTNLTMVLRRD